MSHLLKFRKGWQSEHIAKYVLSKYSFIAEPSTIADDLGSDFFCTLFKIENEQYLLPKNSFAIQIKSNKRDIDITKKISYFKNIEVPFFVGVVSKANLTLKIYSGESICHFFTTSRLPDCKIKIHLVDTEPTNPLVVKKEDVCFLNFHYILELNGDFDYHKSPKEIDKLFNICSLIQGNLSNKRSGRFIYTRYDPDGIQARMIAYTGSHSAKTYKLNFMLELMNAFLNLKWIYEYASPCHDKLMREFKIYEDAFNKIEKEFDKPMPTFSMLENSYRSLKKLLENRR